MKDSQPNGYEDIPTAPAVASHQYLLSQILDRLAAVEEENARQGQRIAELEAQLSDHEDFDARGRAEDRQRLAKLETPAPALREETAEDHIDSLFLAMRSQGVRQTTTKGAARLLGVSKPLIDKIKPHLATDPRFIILRDPSHKQRHLIRLAGT